MKRRNGGIVLGLIEVQGMISDDERGFFVKLGKRLAELRHRQGLTQMQLADKIGVAHQSLNAFEHGTRRVPVSLLPTLARALETTIEELVVGDAPRRLGTRGPRSRIEQQVELIRQLPRAKQKFVVDMIDTVLAQAERANDT